MIRLRGVERGFGAHPTPKVLRGVDLDVADGEFVAILGRSGSGKTTLLNVLGGLDSGYVGTAEVDGRKLDALGDIELSAYRNREVGFVFQSFHLLEHMTCAENVSLPTMFARGDAALDADGAASRAAELLDRVGLRNKANELPSNLSGGEKQRVAVARALFNRPRIIICDEPTGNLDATTGQEIIDLFSSLVHDDGITLIVATHDDAIAAAASRQVVLVDGAVHASATSEQEEGGP